jgi:hypothetical protein
MLPALSATSRVAAVKQAALDTALTVCALSPVLKALFGAQRHTKIRVRPADDFSIGTGLLDS